MRDRRDPHPDHWEWPLVLGWNEYVALPKWGISGLRAKTDTGARSSALHVENIERAGQRVRFQVVLSRQRRDRRIWVESAISRTGRVRSSTGHYQTRYFVKTLLRLGPAEREVELSLVDRERMIYRMLLGRTALAGLLVDPRHAGLLGRPRPRARTRKK